MKMKMKMKPKIPKYQVGDIIENPQNGFMRKIVSPPMQELGSDKWHYIYVGNQKCIDPCPNRGKGRDEKGRCICEQEFRQAPMKCSEPHLRQWERGKAPR